jgi:protein NUD1
LAAIKLTALPQDFASRVPNVRILNLSFNSLKDVTPIRDMVLLKRLFLIGNRISSLSEGTTETLVSLTELQVLDLRYLNLMSVPNFRLNPITLSFYPPVEAKKSDHHRDMFSLVTGRQAQSTWQERDKTFRSTMPRSWELRRKAYQGLIYTACPKLRWFDGSEVSRGHVVEGERVLKSLEGVVNSVRSDKKVSK